MGDRAHCTLIVFGKTPEIAFQHIVELCGDETFEEPNVWQFEDVNYAQLDPEIDSAIKDAGLSYIWLNENGCEFQAGVELYDASTQKFGFYNRCDMDLLFTLRDPFVEAVKWQAFLEQGLQSEVEFT